MPEYNLSYIKAKLQQVAKGRTKKDSVTASAPSRDRLPPGQYLTQQFPVLDLGVRPPLLLTDIKIKIYGEVEKDIVLDYAGLTTLPATNLVKDFHCVTRWSKYDLNWTGVLFKAVFDLVKPNSSAKYVIFESRDNYTTNVPIDALLKDEASIVFKLDGQDIPLLHGGPVRALIPHLYGWKSAKFLSGVKFVKDDVPGFWETRGYHNHADPWLEERFSDY